MYYPFLRARQFELIAIRELASEGAIQGKIVPVLEPVKESISNLNLAHKALVDHEQTAYLILNPLVGELPGDNNDFGEYISTLENSHFLPAFYYTNNFDFILNIIEQYNFNNCLLICYTNYVDDADLRQLCQIGSVTHIMIFEPQKNRRLDSYIKNLGKTYIRLDDVFERQEKNADYLTISAHKFTEEHLYYGVDGYQGFSDFTILPSEYVEGGNAPRAVVIHLTYLFDEEQIWIRHFTSETNDSIANVQGKFSEAAEKAISFCQEIGLNNSAISELIEYFDAGRYPGLGTVKKISIKNHLLVISDYLS